MASTSNMYYPQLRKQDFPVVRYRHGVCEALWQHREAVAHLLGDEEKRTRPSSWDQPRSPILQSIFDFEDPAPAPSPLPSPAGAEIEEEEDDDDTALVPASPLPSPALSLASLASLPATTSPAAAESAAIKAGEDEQTLRLVQQLHADTNGLRRPRRTATTTAETTTPAPSSPAAPSPPPAPIKKRKRAAEDEDEDEQRRRDTPFTSASPPAAKKRALTGPGDMVGQPLPPAQQAVVNAIAGRKVLRTGYPSRNLLRKDDGFKAEISRKTGELKALHRGGMLRRWFGDEDVFGMKMWRWLVGEQGGCGE